MPLILPEPKFTAVETPECTKHYRDSALHRDGDLPAVEYHSGPRQGLKKWYYFGNLHRDGDRPAVILPDGTRKYYKGGVLHREENLPAIVHANGKMDWYNEGKWVASKSPSDREIIVF